MNSELKAIWVVYAKKCFSYSKNDKVAEMWQNLIVDNVL
jgi:hypothetical protein